MCEHVMNKFWQKATLLPPLVTPALGESTPKPHFHHIAMSPVYKSTFAAYTL